MLGDGPLCAPERSRAGSSAGSGRPDFRPPVAAPAAASPVEAVVVSLTKIVGELAKARQTPAKGSELERALDKAEGFAQPGEGLGSSGGQSKSAAFRRLKEALTNDPAGPSNDYSKRTFFTGGSDLHFRIRERLAGHDWNIVRILAIIHYDQARLVHMQHLGCPPVPAT